MSGALAGPGAGASALQRALGGGVGSRSSSLRRARILRAAVDVIAQNGFGAATVAGVIVRAGVSRRSFHAEFDDLDDCVGTVLDETLAHTLTLVSGAFDEHECWRDGLRGALVAVLMFLEDEPALARVAMVESLAGGPVVLAHRERVVGSFRSTVVARIEGEVPHRWPLAAEAMFAAVMGVVHAHLTGPGRVGLLGLLAPLMATLIAPFSDPSEVEGEVGRCERLVREIVEQRERSKGMTDVRWPLLGAPVLPAILVHPRSRRVRECLLFLAGRPGASNREVATAVGVTHASQISRLLSRLAGEGLLHRRSEGVGRRNGWQLTGRGEELLRALGEQRL